MPPAIPPAVPPDRPASASAGSRGDAGRPPFAPDLRAMAIRVAARLAADGAPWPSVGAAALAARGAAGTTLAEFAAEIGIDPLELEAIERGDRPPGDIPSGLRRRVRLAIGDLLHEPDPPPPA